MPSSTEQPSQSGIITSETGERHIPSSQRADGSTRREIKVRPGYRPPEDVQTYKNRTAEAWKNRGKGGVPGAATVEDERGISGHGKSNNNNSSSSSNKNAKRREARRRAKDAAGSKGGRELNLEAGEEENAAGKDVEGGPTTDTATDGDLQSQSQNDGPPPDDDPQQEREKEARRLQKKLRQARELREKKDNGGHLLPEQLEKVIKINELLRQLNSLGFDPE